MKQPKEIEDCAMKFEWLTDSGPKGGRARPLLPSKTPKKLGTAKRSCALRNWIAAWSERPTRWQRHRVHRLLDTVLLIWFIVFILLNLTSSY